MVPYGRNSRLAPCPRCGSRDSILSVPAAYASARSSAAATRAIRDNEVRVTVSAAALPVVAARDLAMAPDGAGRGLFFVAFVLGLGALILHSNGAADWVVGVTAGLSLVLFVFSLSLAVARQSKIKAGRPAAEAVWRMGWYCCRCAVVYFQAGEEPAGVTADQPLAPEHFRHIVWTAGRYGGPA